MIGTPPKTYLDVGYGDGTITSTLCRDWGLQNKSDAYGIEISRNVSAHLPFQQHVIGAEDKSWELPVSTGHFDVITVLNTLHHVADCKSVLQNAYHYLKDGGQLLVREHDVADDDSRDFMKFVDTFFDNVVFGDTSSDKQGIPNYRSAYEWVQLIEKEKFHLNRIDRPATDRLFMQTDMLFTKQPGPR
jgi:2-polyprenyl-3-methyl-5-hydroxy-6-metoxy-1,4-benzoquinol methylase